jgi:PncC family amidohydrolase
MIAIAESCTAGLVSGFLAGVPGASRIFWGSFVTYTADSKTKMLGVPEGLIKKHGAVSRDAALAMAEGALEKSGASWAFSVTGLAGPGGDSPETPLGTSSNIPIGTVWIGRADREISGRIRSGAKTLSFPGSRNEVREAAAFAVLEEVLSMIKRV